MASLSFTLLPEALLQLHGALSCLSKFNDTVSIEAGHDTFRFSVLNPTKSGYASFNFDIETFFERYRYPADSTPNTSGSQVRDGKEKISCQIYIKALLSVFKGRVIDLRDKDTAIERCEVQLFDSPTETECRLVIQMICKLGIIKTYKLTYEPAEIQHALFDKSKARNYWAIDSKFLREIVDHFGPGSEQLDIFSDDGRAVFTSFTKKIAVGTEILKKPVHTSVAIDTRDFDSFVVEEKIHLAISVKDFKAVIFHADTLKTNIVAHYTRPCQPLQFSYSAAGMSCEFTLMTNGDDGGAESAPAQRSTPREFSSRPISMPPGAIPAEHTVEQTEPRPSNGEQMITASTPAARSIPEAVIKGPSQFLAPTDDDHLFVPADDDQQWDEPHYGDNGEEDMVQWDQNMDLESQRRSLGGTLQHIASNSRKMDEELDGSSSMAIPPTQRISQIRGLFD
ncbi:hypothetical protein FQN57_002980 [Myotisia sp. PD_48]|nr:hypothetical protein FQN57_002980 [Myotisia sp. PD_48]